MLADTKHDDRRILGLDGLRGIAALSVVLFHATTNIMYSPPRHAFAGTPLDRWFLDNLDSAVTLFFILSGLVVTLPFARAVCDGGPIPRGDAFFLRRFWRVAPTFYAIYLPFWLWRSSNHEAGVGDLLIHLAFLQNFGEGSYRSTLGVSWSLTNEMFYYAGLAAFAPLLCRLCRRCGPRWGRRVLLGAILALVGVSIGYKLVLMADGPIPFAIVQGPVARLDQFALGMAIAFAAAGGWRLTRTRTVLAYGYGVALLACAFMARREIVGGDQWFHTITALGYGLIVAGIVLGPRQRAVHGILMTRPLATLGAISYSVYLIHEPVLIAAREFGLPPALPDSCLPILLLLIGATLLAATFCYLSVERPAQRAAQRYHDRLRSYAPASPSPSQAASSS